MPIAEITKGKTRGHKAEKWTYTYRNKIDHLKCNNILKNRKRDNLYSSKKS